MAAAVPALAQTAQPAGEAGHATTPQNEAAVGTAASGPHAAADTRLTIEPSRSTIGLGDAVAFTGRREPARRGKTVQLRYRPVGGVYRTVARTTTDAEGRYRLRATPRRTGDFRAISPRGTGGELSSRVERIGVRALLDVSARRHQLRRRGLVVTGDLRPAGAGRRVVVQRETPKGWVTIGAAQTEGSGDYRARWRKPELGRHTIRARFAGDRLNRGDHAALGSPVTVYREDEASYYGPGFYGNTTACGQTLSPETVGVAHRNLPCGTRVRFRYRARTRTIRVIDRGPFIEGRRWDLTDAARQKLRFPRGVDRIWATR